MKIRRSGKVRVGVLISLLLICLVPASLVAAEAPVRIGVTPVFLSDQTSLLGEWRRYLEARLQRPVRFVQRTTYKEITDLILEGRLDFAWICGYPYLKLQDQLRLLAVPLYRGRPLYQSYLIVHASDKTTASIAQLQGKIFAYSDPDSNSGYLVPQYQIQRLGADRSAFFRRSFFTWAHEKVVEAVAMGVAQGGAVDGYIWETMALTHPELTARTRVAQRSQSFGFPPFVANAAVSAEDFAAFQTLLLGMHQDRQGRALLARLNLDGFSVQERTLFDGIAQMMREVERR